MNEGLSFNDICLIPAAFSMVRSRKDVATTSTILGKEYTLPLVSSNMDSVWSVKLSKEVLKAGGISCMHRFMSIEKNVEEFKAGQYIEEYKSSLNNIIKPWVSVGIGKVELERASALIAAGAEVIVLDVANAAAINVVEHFKTLKSMFGNSVYFVVGNFSTAEQILAFNKESGYNADMYKIGQGQGAGCSTSVVTGVGTPSITALLNCKEAGFPIIVDGGIKTTGDFCKALALGASAVFMGRNFAACEESSAKPSEMTILDNISLRPIRKLYRGSAAQSSYETQGKTDYYRAPEGEEMWIECTGTVAQLMQQYEGALRSSMSYMNSFNLEQYRENTKWMKITSSSFDERKPQK